ncbi:hypothetical protein [Paenibacillus sp. N3.4]|uniref:hypothetical protein n=1 Tax=Paenibacillus sp. N3.4 TaxID=2603222 RepID=UPI0011CBB908|nr:hypothetical protein [Paenibacillus sp. N3.4]TXK83713.1 hypothetical protein FU659_12415 [Paenibacillus sp. N3.4]
MGTRLLSEQMIKKRFPHLRYLRIHTQEKNTATIYAWDDDLQLADQEIRSLKQFASDYLNPYVCFKVKAYPYVQEEKVPQMNELPEIVIQAATSRKLNQDGIKAVINRLFPFGRLNYDRYEAAEGMIHFQFHAIRLISDKEKEAMKSYLNELIPLGSYCEVTFY